MTRETKIGLVVAGSFLCLVCIVVASKWRRGDDASKEPEQQEIKVAAVHPTADPLKKDEPAKPGLRPAPSFPVANPQDKAMAPVGDLKMPPPGGLPAMHIPAPLDLPLPSKPAPKLDTPPGGTLTFPPLPKPDDLKPPPGALVKKPDEIPAPTFGSDFRLPTPPIVLAQDKDKTPPPVGPAFPIDPKPTVTFPAPMPLKPLDDRTPVVGGPIVIPPPIGGVTTPLIDVPKPAPTPLKPLDDRTAPPSFPPLSGPDALKFPPLGTPPPLDKDLRPAPVLTFPKDDLKPPPALTFPKDDNRPPLTIPKFGDNDLPSTPAIVPSVPFDLNKKPMPIVRDTSADAYVCQAADTSFAILSMRLYGNEKYADALLVYNRDHAKLIPNSNALLTNPPQLTTGQRVLHPPVTVLQSDYRLLIRDATPPPAAPTIAPTGPVNLARPMPLTPTAAPITTSPGAGPTRTYRVQNPAGESILDIAERQLGNRSHWQEVYRINQSNPAVQPPRLIPAGTELKLP